MDGVEDFGWGHWFSGNKKLSSWWRGFSVWDSWLTMFIWANVQIYRWKAICGMVLLLKQRTIVGRSYNPDQMHQRGGQTYDKLARHLRQWNMLKTVVQTIVGQWYNNGCEGATIVHEFCCITPFIASVHKFTWKWLAKGGSGAFRGSVWADIQCSVSCKCASIANSSKEGSCRYWYHEW